MIAKSLGSDSISFLLAIHQLPKLHPRLSSRTLTRYMTKPFQRGDSCKVTDFFMLTLMSLYLHQIIHLS